MTRLTIYRDPKEILNPKNLEPNLKLLEVRS
jgi:hypothetical protein